MKFEPQCKTLADLYREWARVLDMCERTEVKPEDGWKFDGKVRNHIPGYEFSIGIIEGMHVFRGDTLHRGSVKHIAIGVDADGYIRCLYEDGQVDSHSQNCLSWNPPKQEPIIP